MASRDLPDITKYTPELLAAARVPAEQKTSTVFFLHDVGQKGSSLVEAVSKIRSTHISFILPTATIKPVSLICNGSVMPSWFDIVGIKDDVIVDLPTLKEAVKAIEKMISDEILEGVPSNKIVLGGFSQGAVLACYVALTTQIKLGGVILLNTIIPCKENFPKDFSEVNKNTPFFQAHGVIDDFVKYQWGVRSNELLTTWLTKVEFKSYENLGHAVNEAEFRDIQQWMSTVL